MMEKEDCSVSIMRETFGEENLSSFMQNNELLAKCSALEIEIQAKHAAVQKAFGVDLTLADILVPIAAGVVTGACGGAFKSYVPEHGKFKHDHKTKRTAIDYKVPKPEGYKGSVQALHRQFGPGHDLFRFREALDLMSGKTKDFPLWGKTISERTGGELHSGGMSQDDFLKAGGFRIPDDPKAELIHHLIIDFFTKKSLPIPGTTYIADKNEVLAKIMVTLYDHGFNLKNAVGSGAATALLQLIMRDYIFLFKAVPESRMFEKMEQENQNAIKDCFDCFNLYLNSQEYHVMEMMAHGSSFLLDTAISVSSKNYTGLFELDYLSLLVLATHTVKYVLEANRRKKVGKAEIEKLKVELDEANSDFYKRIEDQLERIGTSDAIKEDLLSDSGERTLQQLDHIEKMQKRQKEVFEEFEK